MEKIKTLPILKVMLLSLVLAALFSDCLLAAETKNSDPNNSSKYLDAVREFADNVLKYGRDTYGPKHTPLFVDGLMVRDPNNPDYGKDGVFKPVEWIAPNGERWVLSNLASQQNLFRTLNGLTAITGEPKYKQAAMDAIMYAFENLRSPNGLLYWGHVVAYDAKTDNICGVENRHHCFKLDYPYYDLMWEVNPEFTKRFIEAFWSAHVIDWSNLDMDRIGHFNDASEEPWNHEYEGGPTFFKGKGGYANSLTGSSLVQAGTTLYKLSSQEQPLVWSKRLAKRFVDTRHPKTGISALVYNNTWYVFEDMKEHFVDPYTTVFPYCPFEYKYLYYPEDLGEVLTTFPWMSMFLVGEMLGEEGKEFKRWALEEFTAWGKVSYRKRDNSFVPMLTDGTNLEGYVWKKWATNLNVAKPCSAGPSFFWAYSVAYSTTGDEFMWQMVRDIALGNGLGDIGKTPASTPKLKTDTTCSNVYNLFGFLELYEKTNNPYFLQIAQHIGDNIVDNQLYKGFFVPSTKHIYTRFDCFEPLALLRLEAAMKSQIKSVPRPWPSVPLFVCPYRHKQEVVDRRVIYALTESPELPLSLHEAAAIGDINLVRSLLDKGIGVDSWDDSLKKTALQHAAIGGHREIVELLLDKGARIDAQEDFPGGTALEYVAENGHRDVIELLIARGANVNAKRTGYPQGDTPLHSTVRAGHRDIIELLIAKKADINAKNEAGQTPLELAVRQSPKDIIELLITKGVDINAKNNKGQTPLDIAVNQNRREIVKLLVAKGADISIHVAARFGDLAIIENIIQDGTDLNAKDASGKTPLHQAVEYGQKEVIELLIAKGANVNIKDNDGNTPGHIALGENKRSLLELLIDKGVNVASIHLSAYQGDLDKIRNYIEKGTDVNIPDSYGAIPLHYAAVCGSKELVEFLIAKGANVNAKDKVKITPLHRGAVSGSKDVVKLLVDNGANINAKGQWDYTPMFYAVWSGIIEVVELLVGKGADVNAKDEWGWTPLHYMAQNNRRYMAEFLIAKGADVNAEDKWGEIPLQVAEDKGHTEIVELLRKHDPEFASSSDQKHNLSITGVSAPTKCSQDYSIPVVVNIENQGDCSESFDVKLIDVTDGKEIGTKSVHLSHAGVEGMDEICDLIFTEESTSRQRFGTIVKHGDVNGDGYDDLLVSASRYGDIQGRAYLYYGEGDMDENADKIFFGEKPGDYFSVGGCIADLNGDRHDDVILGALGYNSDQGRVYIYYGGPDLDEHADIIIDGEPGVAGGFGRTCTAGDVNGDGYEDLFVSAIRYPKKNYRGRIYLYYGGNPMDTTCDLILTGENDGDVFGWMTDASEDVDGDNLCDLLTGTRFWPKSAPSGGDAIGRAYLFYGGKPMDESCDVIFTGENRSDEFGVGIEVGDVDNDGRSDVLVGARGYDRAGGRVYLYWGKAKENMSDKPDRIFEGEGNQGDNYGGDDIEVGYVDDDNYGDIAITAFGHNSGRGRIYLYYGNTQADLDTECDHIFTGIENVTNWPMHAVIGDFNKDGYGDLVVGAWAYNNQQGTAWLYYGSPGDSTQLKFDWETSTASPGKHTLKAMIAPVAGEEDVADNSMTVEVEVKESSK